MMYISNGSSNPRRNSHFLYLFSSFVSGKTAVVIQNSSSGHWVQKIIRIIIICLYRMISLPHLTSQSSLYIITCQYHDLLSIVCKRVAIIDPLINVASY